MTSIIKFSLKELKTLVSDQKSCIEEKQVTQKIALQPWCLGNLVDSIKNLLDYKIGKYDEQFVFHAEKYSGILLSYKNLKVMENLGAIRNDCSEITLEIQADYFIFRPYIGALLRGIVNKKSVTHLGVIVHRVFNVVIPRPTNTNDMRWIGTTITEGQHVVFRIVMLDLFGALPYIRGELDERYLLEQEDLTPEEIEGRLLVNHVHFDKTKPQTSKTKTIVKTEADIEDKNVKPETYIEDFKVKPELDIKKEEVVVNEESTEIKLAKRLSRPRRSVAMERKSYYEDDKLTDEESKEERSNAQTESTVSKTNFKQSSFDKVPSLRTPKRLKKKTEPTPEDNSSNDYADEERVMNQTTEKTSDAMEELLSPKGTRSRNIFPNSNVVKNSGDAKSSRLRRKHDESSSTVREHKRKRTV